jgi:hypothetical protein
MPVKSLAAALKTRKVAAKKLAKQKSVTQKRKRMPLIASGSATGSTTGSSTQIWRMWNTSIITSASTTSANDIWQLWNTSGSITTGASNQTTIVSSSATTWGSWNVAYEAAQQVQIATPEERQRLAAERQRLNDEHYARQRVLQEESDKAKARAIRLLRENLDEKQRADLDANGYFELEAISRNGDRRKYRIHRKWSGNIQQVDQSGRRIKTLCIHPREATPIEDSMLAQKLMLEGGAEEDLLRIANHS